MMKAFRKGHCRYQASSAASDVVMSPHCLSVDSYVFVHSRIERCVLGMKGCITYIALILLSTNMLHAETKCSMTSPCEDLGGGEDFKEPIQLSSTSSTWSTTLTVDIGTIKYNWLVLKRRVYNGSAPGPTITVKRGDHFELRLINNLGHEGNDLARPIDEENHPNTTNLHTHGLHISSKSPQDNVLISIRPKSRFHYRYKIHHSNSPGTYWYHAHLTGSTLLQVNGGLSGMLIIIDDPDEMPAELSAVSCPNNCDKDIQLHFQPLLTFRGRNDYGLVQDRLHDYEGFRNERYLYGNETLRQWLSDRINYFTTNGQLKPKLTMNTGQLYRFRMVNAGGEYTLELYITDANGRPTPNCEIREIAYDGVYLATPRKMHDKQTFLAPAARADWLVKCTKPGVYKIASFPDFVNELSIGDLNRYEGDLVTLKVYGTNAASSFPVSLPVHTTCLNDLRQVPDKDIEGRFVVEMNPKSFLNRERWGDPHLYRYKMKLGAVQEWTILNTHSFLTHPLHMHINHFQVISYNKYTGGVAMNISQIDRWYLTDVNDFNHRCYYQRKGYISGDSGQEELVPPVIVTSMLRYLGHDKRFTEDSGGTLGYVRTGDWRDILLLPPLSNITIRFVPTDFTGDALVHCHIFAHSDAGMMMNVKIVEEGESTDANVTSGNAYPGTCRKCDRYPPNNATNLCGVTSNR